MKFLIQFLVFAVCYCLNAYAAPFFKDLGFALGILVFGDQDSGAILCGLLAGALAVLVYGAGFIIIKRIRERRMDGIIRNAPGAKRIVFGLLILLMDAAITDAAGIQVPYFGSGDFVVPTSGGQLLYDLVFLSTFHLLGVLGLVSLIWGLVVFCRRNPVVPKTTKPKPVVLTEAPAPTPAKSKARFCKLCGDPIDPMTRKCTGCRKQYFRPPVFTDKHCFIAATAVACGVIAFLVFALVSQNNQIKELNNQISELESAHTDCADTIFDLNRELLTKENNIEFLSEEIEIKAEIIAFFEDHAVIVPDDSTGKYHTYYCPRWWDTDYWIYNVEAAEDLGYEPCTCCD